MNNITKSAAIVVSVAAVCAIIWWTGKSHRIRRSGFKKKQTKQPKIGNIGKSEHGVKSNPEILTDKTIDSQGNCNEIFAIGSPRIHLKTGEGVHSRDIPPHRSKIVTLCSETQATTKMFPNNKTEAEGTNQSCQNRTNRVTLEVGAELSKIKEKPRERGEINAADQPKMDSQDKYNDNRKNVLQNVNQNTGTARDVRENRKTKTTSKMLSDGQEAKATKESSANNTNQASLETKLIQPEEKQQERRTERKGKDTTSKQSPARQNYDTENYVSKGENVPFRRKPCNVIRDT